MQHPNNFTMNQNFFIALLKKTEDKEGIQKKKPLCLSVKEFLCGKERGKANCDDASAPE